MGESSAIDVPAARLPRIARGAGASLWDTDGRRYVDGSGGPAVFSLGHGDPRIAAAVADQMARVAHGYRYLFTSDPLEELGALLGELAGADLTEVVFCLDGSEAVEGALKIALQYHHDRGEPQRTRFIARGRSWHGNTLMATALSGFAARTGPFAAAMPEVGRVSPANLYRPAGAPLVPFLVAELEAEIARIGAERVAAFVVESVVGAAGGVVPPPPGYLPAVAEVCRRHGILLVADEVMCGAGRCGTWRASAAEGVVPDILAVAKSLSAGYLPLGATLYRRGIGEVLAVARGGPLTGHTYTGHTTCLAAALAVQRIVAEEGLVARVAAEGARWQAQLGERLGRFGAVGDVRGRGFFIGIELVADRETKAPFDPALGLHARIRAETLARGLICYPCSGNVDGVAGDTVILAPPFNATADELAEIAEKLEAGLAAALAGIGR